MNEPSPFDSFISPELRDTIERRYYERVNQQSTLEEALKDPTFLNAPANHAALFADHGVIHARDVARGTRQVLDAVHGVLIPRRNAERFAWMHAYGVIVALVHDIGMVDLSEFGRFMHPERATQTVLSSEFDDIVDDLWTQDGGAIAERLAVFGDVPHGGSAKAVFRELLAMAVCHSKTKVGVDLLNDRVGLREAMQAIATTDLHRLYLQQQAQRAAPVLETAGREGVDDHDDTDAAPRAVGADVDTSVGGEPSSQDENVAGDGFSWLVSDDGPVRELVDDVIDTLRALRAADALRQRGTVLKTSGNYEVFVDQRSANAIYALRSTEGHLFLLEVAKRISAGEANVASSEIDQAGNLRVSFHRGRFRDDETVLYAAECAALIVNDIQADAIESFQRPPGDDGLPRSSDVEILLESVDDNPAFADMVRLALASLNPAAAASTRVVPSLQSKSALERGHYLKGEVLDWDRKEGLKVLEEVAQYGHRTDQIDPVQAFTHVRRIHLGAGETLIRAGSPAGFVYIAEDVGLRGVPLGGYGEFLIPPWTPVGVTGVIRGSVRNADVVADQDVTVLSIPRDAYVEFWHRTYDTEAFKALFAG